MKNKIKTITIKELYDLIKNFDVNYEIKLPSKMKNGLELDIKSKKVWKEINTINYINGIYEIDCGDTILMFFKNDEMLKVKKLNMKTSEAVKAANEFIKKVNELEEEYGLTLNSDTGDIYLSFLNSKNIQNQLPIWGHVELGWDGDGGIKVIENKKDEIIKIALSKLSKEEKDALGIE